MVLIICFFLLEIFSFGLVVLYSYLTGRDMEPLKAQFLISQPFHENPIIKYTSANYVGFLRDPSVSHQWWVADPILGWRNGKNVGSTHTHGYAEGLAWRTTNSQGFLPAGELDFNVSQKKQPGTFRIIIFGGSTVAGYGVKSPLKNLPSQFTRTLKKKSNPKIGFTKFEVINGGVDGYFSINQYLYFITELIHYNPDLVIFYDGWNELHSQFWDPNPIYAKRFSKHDELQKRLNKSYTISGSALIFVKSINTFFANLSFQLASLWIPKRLIEKIFIDKTLVLMRDEENGGLKIKNQIMKWAAPNISQKAIEFYETNIRDTIAFAREKDIKIAYFLQPILGVTDKQPHGIELDWLQLNPIAIKNRKLYYADVRNRLKYIEAQYQDPSEVCIRDLSKAIKGEKSRVFSDSGHLNEKGNLILAHSMVDSLLECSIIQKTTTKPTKD